MTTILHVAYPLAPVGPDAVGGAEQILFTLDRAAVAASHRSIVVAMAGSQVHGELAVVPDSAGCYDDNALERARRRHAITIADALNAHQVDIVHMHGFDFDAYLPPSGPPVLATLHCPPDWYNRAALHPARAGVWLNAVSARQHASLQPNERLVASIENGVEMASPYCHARQNFALMMSRIAPEKGTHIGLRAARRAGLPMLAAGRAYPYPDHDRYVREEIAPLLDRQRRLIGPVGSARKRRLLAAARCVVVPSQVEETSSLAAREALAAGTPVVAFAAGALADTVEHGVTGFLVRDEAEMAEAMLACATIAPERCQAEARQRFSADRMIGQYLELYARLLSADRHSTVDL